jgi:hypothetical protein
MENKLTYCVNKRYYRRTNRDSELQSNVAGKLCLQYVQCMLPYLPTLWSPSVLVLAGRGTHGFVPTISRSLLLRYIHLLAVGLLTFHWKPQVIHCFTKLSVNSQCDKFFKILWFQFTKFCWLRDQFFASSTRSSFLQQWKMSETKDKSDLHCAQLYLQSIPSRNCNAEET